MRTVSQLLLLAILANAAILTSQSSLRFLLSKVPFLDSYLNFELTHIEDLVNCQNDLSLDRPEYSQLVACDVIGDNYYGMDLSDPGAKFVRRSSLRNKNESSIRSGHNANILMYPLREDVIARNVESLLIASNVPKFDFMGPRWNLGFYYELVTPSSGKLSAFKCTGEVYLDVNKTEHFIRLVNDPNTQFVDQILNLLNQGRRHGFFFSLQNTECSEPNKHLGGKLHVDFTVVSKQDFPYLTVHHSMEARTFIFSLWNYRGEITQQRDLDQNDTGIYNTTIEIDSESVLTDLLTFRLKQSFVNIGDNTGHESMTVTHDKHPILSVSSAWHPSFFTKVFQLHHYDYQDPEGAAERGPITVADPLTISYSNKKEHTHIDLNFKSNKIFLNWIVRAIADLMEYSLDKHIAAPPTTKRHDEL